MIKIDLFRKCAISRQCIIKEKRSVDFYSRHASRLHPVDLFAYLERGIDIAFDSEDNTRAALIYGTLPWSETEPLDFSLLDNVVSRMLSYLRREKRDLDCKSLVINLANQ